MGTVLNMDHVQQLGNLYLVQCCFVFCSSQILVHLQHGSLNKNIPLAQSESTDSFHDISGNSYALQSQLIIASQATLRSVYNPYFKDRETEVLEAQWLAQGHPTGQWQNLEHNPHLLAPSPFPYPLIHASSSANRSWETKLRTIKQLTSLHSSTRYKHRNSDLHSDGSLLKVLNIVLPLHRMPSWPVEHWGEKSYITKHHYPEIFYIGHLRTGADHVLGKQLRYLLY